MPTLMLGQFSYDWYNSDVSRKNDDLYQNYYSNLQHSSINAQEHLQIRDWKLDCDLEDKQELTKHEDVTHYDFFLQGESILHIEN